MKPISLTTRLALLFAALSLITTASIGYFLYSRLAAQLSIRDDAALVNRADQIRTLLRDADVMYLIQNKPQLFANMLGNTESLLVLRFPGKSPLIEINPGQAAIPALNPTPSDDRLSLASVTHLSGDDGIPFIATAANAKVFGAKEELEILTGRRMIERTHLLREYQRQIISIMLGVALLIALLTYWLTKKGLVSIGVLADQTNAIGIGNLSTRIKVDQCPPELSPLVDAFNQMLGRLETSFSQLSQVSADMAHDLRTPMSTMLGQIEIALGKTRDTDYYEKLLGSNFEELQRLSRMIDSMLFLAKAEHPDHVIARKQLDTQEQIERVIDYFELIAEEKKVEIICKSEGDIFADPDLLRRALANLLSNAVRHASEFSTVLVQVEQHATETLIHVENHGETIQPEQLNRLFDRFYKADASRGLATDSNGLGLAIVRSIMGLHQGDWRVDSTDGVTRFTLKYPKAT
jgi:two-component system heavy metal sensor histidine kinase CusS